MRKVLLLCHSRAPAKYVNKKNLHGSITSYHSHAIAANERKLIDLAKNHKELKAHYDKYVSDH